jgi:lysyl-tRNA synthetase class 1
MGESTPNAIEAALEPFETAKTGFTETAIVDALRKIKDSVPEGPERRRWWAESSAALFREVDDAKSLWGTAFGPMAVLKNDAGDEMYVPDIKDADGATIDYWTQRSKDSKHPILKARYADLTWEFAPIAAKRKADANQARAAIDAYIVASRFEYRSAIQPIRYLRRALDLALSISDANRTQAVVNEMFVLYDRVAKPHQAGTFPFLFDSLYGSKKVPLTSEQTARIIDSLEHVLKVSTPLGSDFNPISAEGAASRLATHYRKENRPEDVKRVWRAYGGAMEEAAKQASPMLALGWLQPVLAIYTREGLHEAADRVSAFLSGNQEQMSKEFKTISADFKVPADKLKAYVDALTDGGLESALGMIAARFLTRVSDAKEVLEEGAKKAPLQALIPIQKIRDGHVVATIGSVEDDPEGRLINQLAQNISIQTFFLHAGIQRLLERHTPMAADIAKWICEGGLFAGREDLIKEGVAAFLDGDDVKAVHVLLPQIESGLRQLAASVAIPPKKLIQRSGLMEDKNLTDILGDLAFQDVAGEDIVLYLRALLNDKRGHNIRNHVMHGVMPAAFFNRQVSLRVLHVVLLLGDLRVKKRDSNNSEN